MVPDNDSSNVSPVDIGAFAVIGTTMPGPGRTRLNKDILDRWNQKAPFPEAIQDDASPSANTTSPAPIKPEQNFGVVRYPLFDRVIPREIKLQEWEGQVQEVGANYFSARLVDLTAGETEETEEVGLPVADLTESDRSLLVPGAVFRWIIGYRYTDGIKERFTRVVIRRLPIWTEQEIISADREATELHHALFGNNGNRAAATGSD